MSIGCTKILRIPKGEKLRKVLEKVLRVQTRKARAVLQEDVVAESC